MDFERFWWCRCSKQAQEAARQTEDTDELDALLDAYDKAAQADKQAVERTRKEEKKPASMKELRAEGLANPLTAENRSAQTGVQHSPTMRPRANCLLLPALMSSVEVSKW